MEFISKMWKSFPIKVYIFNLPIVGITKTMQFSDVWKRFIDGKNNGYILNNIWQKNENCNTYD